MPAPEFLDTNVLVYAYDSSDATKQQIAKGLLRDAIAGRFVVSAQVLAEFATTLLHKLSPPVRPRDVLDTLDALLPLTAVPADSEVVRRAVEAHAKYGIHFYDGMIVASAEKSGCKRIWSEDFSAGQQYFGIEVKNPFAN